MDLDQKQKFEYEYSETISFGSFRARQLQEQIKNRKKRPTPEDRQSQLEGKLDEIALDENFDRAGIEDEYSPNNTEFGFESELLKKKFQESRAPQTALSFDRAQLDQAQGEERFEVYQSNLTSNRNKKRRKPFFSPRTRLRLKNAFHSFAETIGEDWVCLALVSVITALISLFQDYLVKELHDAKKEIAASTSGFLQFVAWTAYMLLLVTCSVGFTHYLSPAGAGSGIPELKTILKGLSLKGFFSLRTLLAKVGGLILVVGAGLPIGREGPLCHSASIVAHQLLSRIPVFYKMFVNESRRLEILAAACAMGVAATNGSPIGGVLFTIEVTSTYFAVRNYWRGFFAAIVGALIAQIIRPSMFKWDSIAALFPTSFRSKPYMELEVFFFVLLGAFAGLGGALFSFANKKIVETRRALSKPGQPLEFLEKNRFIYPSIIIFCIACLTFPDGIGRWMSGTLPQDINNLLVPYPLNCVEDWKGVNVFLALIFFFILKFIITCFCITLPTPTGVWICTFAVGCGMGRFWGEVVRAMFPNGIENSGIYNSEANSTCTADYYAEHLIIPGGYAFVGGAAFASGVTHTISSAIIALELTGQLEYLLPAMIAVLVAIHVSQRISPSFYDNLIKLKSLPYLPDLRKGESYNLMVTDFMNQNLYYISTESSYARVARVLQESNFISFPVVDNPESCVLLGSIQRQVLQDLLDDQLAKPVPTTPNGTRKVLALETTLPSSNYASIQATREDFSKKKLKLETIFDTPKAASVASPPLPRINVEDTPSLPVQPNLSETPAPPSVPDTTNYNPFFPPAPPLLPETEQTSPATSPPPPLTPPSSSTTPSENSLLPPPAQKKSRFTTTQVLVPPTSPPPAPNNPTPSPLVASPDPFMPLPSSSTSNLIPSPSMEPQLPAPTSDATPSSPKEEQSREELDEETKRELESIRLPPTPWGDVIHTTTEGHISKVEPAQRSITRAMGPIPHLPTSNIDETWRLRLLREKIDLRGVEIDPAPFQIVERTSLYKVHTLFSLLGLHIAYVTSVGRLVGIVGLKEIRSAVERFGGVRTFEK